MRKLAKTERKKQAGTFDISPNHTVFGELTIAGPKSRLRLHNTEAFPTHQIAGGCITGTLHDLTKVSLIDCVTPGAPGHRSSPSGRYYFARVLPHYIILGDQFIRTLEPSIKKIVMYLDDASTLFYDFEAFGCVLFDAEPIVQQIIEKEPHRKERRTGSDARILYYTGRNEIVRADTAIGRVLVEHRPDFRGGDGRKGGLLRDDVAVSLCFQSPVQFHEAIRRAHQLAEYLGLLVGRSQNLKGLYIGTDATPDSPSLLSVHWVMYQKRASIGKNRAPSAHEILMDGVREPAEFVSVTTSWLERQELWHNARWRFFNSFAQQQRYDIDRLVASANMFDILPDSAVPKQTPLSADIAAARTTADDLFRGLPKSPERQSVMVCLKHLGKSNLKRKVRHRAAFLLDSFGEAFPDLSKVTDAAVDCRNYYVHGTESDFDYDRNFDAVVFFTDRLEFVFAVSDLIEAGWDFKRWMAKGTSMSHPFGRYKVVYKESLRKLLALLPPEMAHTSPPSA